MCKRMGLVMRIGAWLAGLVLLGAMAASPVVAAVQTLDLSGASDSGTFAADLAIGGIGEVNGSRSTGGVFEHRAAFMLASGNGGNVAASVSLGSLLGLEYQVFDATTSLAITASAAAPNLLVFAASPGGSYFVQFTGIAGTSGGSYAASITITPIPGAILLMVPALAGLGMLARRRRTAG